MSTFAAKTGSFKTRSGSYARNGRPFDPLLSPIAPRSALALRGAVFLVRGVGFAGPSRATPAIAVGRGAWVLGSRAVLDFEPCELNGLRGVNARATWRR